MLADRYNDTHYNALYTNVNRLVLINRLVNGGCRREKNRKLIQQVTPLSGKCLVTNRNGKCQL